MPAISETTRKADSELDEEFNRDYPSIFGGALIKFMKHETQYICTYAELLTKLSNVLYKPEMSGWPKSPKGLANILKRHAPALVVVGIKLCFDEKPRKNGYHVTIHKQGEIYE